MNSLFYLAIDRLPRNLLALAVAVSGVGLLTALRLDGAPLGFAFAFANCAGFMAYVLLGHRIANRAADGSRPGRGSMAGIDQLGAAMLVAAVGNRGRRVLVGHPLRLRPAGHGAAAAGHVRPDAGAPAGVRHADRRGRPAPGAHPPDLLGIGPVIAAIALHRSPDAT